MTLRVTKYKVIIVQIGTNHIEKDTPAEIVQKLDKLLKLLKEKNPQATLAYSGILFRPTDIPAEMEKIRARKHDNPRHSKDFVKTPHHSDNVHHGAMEYPATTPTKPLTNNEIYQKLHPMEKKRRTTNKAIRRLCKKTGTVFLESWGCVELDNWNADLNNYADDGLHLREQGIQALGNYLGSNSVRLLHLRKTAQNSIPPKKN